MASIQIDGQKIDDTRKSRNPVLYFDKLQMYMGRPYSINVESAIGEIVIHPPTIGKIIDLGEKNFYSTLSVFTTNTTSHRLLLWENGIDWNEISDYQLFCMLYKQVSFDATQLIFGDIDFNDFQLVKRADDEVSLYNEKLNIEINEEVYQHIAQYLRNVFNIFPEEKITKSGVMKEMFIAKDKRELANQKFQKKESSSIQSLISACVNHPGFKYKLKELEDMGVCEFYDSVKRLQVYESTTALMKGMYSGMIDTKQISSDSYNFMRDF